jgi:hypothetical protein
MNQTFRATQKGETRENYGPGAADIGYHSGAHDGLKKQFSRGIAVSNVSVPKEFMPFFQPSNATRREKRIQEKKSFITSAQKTQKRIN